MSDAGFYQTKGRALAITFNLENYKESSGQQPRPGSSKDAEDIKGAFSERNFDVLSFKDLTTEEIRAELKAICDLRDHYRCLFVFLLAHGYQDGIYGINGCVLSIQEIQSCLCAKDCPAFKDRPKVLIFQSCRLQDGPTDSVLSVDNEDHFLLAFSTGIGTKSYRDTEEGTFYIQTLLNVIKDMGDDDDFASLLTVIRRKLLQKPYTKYNDQKSEYHNLLTDKVYVKRLCSDSIDIPCDPETTSLGVMETTSSQEHQRYCNNVTVIIGTKSLSLPTAHKMFISGIENNQTTSKSYKKLAATSTLHSKSSCAIMICNPCPLQDIINNPGPPTKPKQSIKVLEKQQGEDIQFNSPLEPHSECSTPVSTPSTELPNEEATPLRHPLQRVTSENEEENNGEHVNDKEKEIPKEDSINGKQMGNDNEQIEEIPMNNNNNDNEGVNEPEEVLGGYSEKITDSHNSNQQLFSHLINLTETPVEEEFIYIDYELIGVHARPTQFMEEEWQEIFMPANDIPLNNVDNGSPTGSGVSLHQCN